MAKFKTKAEILEKTAPLIAGFIAIILACIKFVTGIIGGSISVLSSAIDSMLDFMMSFLNFLALKKSKQNPNERFNYGYGKIEPLAAFLQGFFIFGIGIFIAYQSVCKFSSQNYDVNTDLSIAVMLVCIAITGILVVYLQVVAKKSGSLIISADSLHYKSDFLANLAIVCALVIIKLTNFAYIDAIFGLLISFYIVFAALKLLKKSAFVLLDKAVDDEIIGEIRSFVLKHKKIKGMHEFRSRKSANTCYLSIHIVFDSEISLLNAHKIGDEIENYIKSKFNQYIWVINLHFDPINDEKKDI